MSPRFLLDTNVLSEPARPDPAPEVLAWLRTLSPSNVAISALVLGEIGRGVELLPPGRGRDALAGWLEGELPRRFRGRVLPVDESVARAWGRLGAEAQRIGRPLPVIDGLMLATAAAHDLTFATRNVGDCGNRGVPVVDPWA